MFRNSAHYLYDLSADGCIPTFTALARMVFVILEVKRLVPLRPIAPDADMRTLLSREPDSEARVMHESKKTKRRRGGRRAEFCRYM
jgi:hypothetical protein